MRITDTQIKADEWIRRIALIGKHENPCAVASEAGGIMRALLDELALCGIRQDEPVWIVTDYDGGGVRGVFASGLDAEAEIASICNEHYDLTRSDFVFSVHRIRRPGEVKP